jgi:hypothetical protein
MATRPFDESPSGQFLLEQPLPRHILYAEPAGQRMRVELAGAVVAHSDAALLRPSSKRTQHPRLGRPPGGPLRSVASASVTPPGAIRGRRVTPSC